MKSSRNTACSIPATGPCAPARTLVAVRAIVPVTQNPPNSAEPRLAAPCATSSQFERCRRPVMPSATLAQLGRPAIVEGIADRLLGDFAANVAAAASGEAPGKAQAPGLTGLILAALRNILRRRHKGGGSP